MAGPAAPAASPARLTWRSIPWIGGLFGRTSRQSTDTELYLFITPHVIRTDQEADSLSQPFIKNAEKGKP